MKAKYPNLELIEYKFKQFAFDKYDSVLKNSCFPKFIVYVFMQTWGNTATGFNLKNYASGQAFTDEYTTVIKLEWSIRVGHGYKSADAIYGVFFGNELAYACLNPNKNFYIDLRNGLMLSQKDAIKEYGNNLLMNEDC